VIDVDYDNSVLAHLIELEFLLPLIVFISPVELPSCSTVNEDCAKVPTAHKASVYRKCFNIFDGR
jgi:hypothetical protein